MSDYEFQRAVRRARQWAARREVKRNGAPTTADMIMGWLARHYPTMSDADRGRVYEAG